MASAAFDPSGLAPVSPDTRLNSFSLVKSLVGALALQAVADHCFEELDVPLRQVLGPAATVGETLTMTSGLVMTPELHTTADTMLNDAGFSPFGPLASSP